MPMTQAKWRVVNCLLASVVTVHQASNVRPEKMKMLYTIPPMVVVIIWGISHFYDFAFTYTVFHRQIWIYSESGDFGFEYDGKTKKDKFFESGRDYGSNVIRDPSLLESLRGSRFYFSKWYRIRMIRVPYWVLFGITLMGTVSLYAANRVGTRIYPPPLRRFWMTWKQSSSRFGR